ncbi:Imm50 family immunity protein [Cupriavidus sp. WKF15]|uniref:Imm50 family immunity protein n=1 Tax=Cupriavidus sp. WKF15 TaxID=3032282 RepID=UPI0023E23B7A|nr:Imm50 family immunity protein [Cupriavidus sp. WKF15]WER48602.1 Imm50 family immunity protein [Cupriavidus sp. WKF15]
MNGNGNDVISLINGAYLVKDVFGYWPAFHDAEINSICIRRAMVRGESILEILISIHHWGQDNPNYNGTEKDCVIDFMFKNVLQGGVNIHSIPDVGWIDEISFEENDGGGINVNFRPLSGFDIAFSCEFVEVIGIRRASD